MKKILFLLLTLSCSKNYEIEQYQNFYITQYDRCSDYCYFKAVKDFTIYKKCRQNEFLSWKLPKTCSWNPVCVCASGDSNYQYLFLINENKYFYDEEAVKFLEKEIENENPAD